MLLFADIPADISLWNFLFATSVFPNYKNNEISVTRISLRIIVIDDSSSDLSERIVNIINKNWRIADTDDMFVRRVMLSAAYS